jgi:hypothetical protein
MNARSAMLITVAAMVAGCAWQTPQSEVTGRLYSKVDMNTYPTGILAIDGVSTYYDPMTISPGRHVLTVQGASPSWSTAVKEYVLDAKPCVRYYIAAYRPSPNVPDFEVRIDEILPISGCPTTPNPNPSPSRY